jgi:DNA-binding response OmpR family regulator
MDDVNTILIVDDQPSARETLNAALHGQGYNLEFAADGPEGLDKASRLLPALIILDVMMPGMDGFEVCQRLRADPLLAHVPIIMLTALGDFDTLVRGIEAGADDFINKPFNRVELLARVRTIIRLNRYRRLLSERIKFEWVVDHAGDGYLVIDNEDHIHYANPQARLYLNLSTGDDEPITEAFLPLARKQYHLEPQEAWLTWPELPSSLSKLVRYLVRPESATANAFWLQIETLKLPLHTEGSWVIHLKDVTAQVMLERDMRGFHVMVSHKLRTPLAGILGGLRLLAQSGRQLSREKIVSLSELALDNVERLYHSMGDVLEFLSAPFSLESQASFYLSELGQTVAEISNNLDIDAIKVTCPDELKNLGLALSQQAVELSLWEVLENAKKFHPEQSPTVEIEVTPHFVGSISLKILDDGLSLSPEQLMQIWTPYYQADKYATGEIKGMGLGLAMVAILVREASGECRAYNRQDQPGMVVELILPVVKKNEQREE